ncbi:hypothetical protein B0H10DRAFT_2189462 [Mycena sp. CBHHK59/15]|nr:hypothetical protein B0H10DRAFT_2189462 [Mycena sp. CBHHK59/15]
MDSRPAGPAGPTSPRLRLTGVHSAAPFAFRVSLIFCCCSTGSRVVATLSANPAHGPSPRRTGAYGPHAPRMHMLKRGDPSRWGSVGAVGWRAHGGCVGGCAGVGKQRRWRVVGRAGLSAQIQARHHRLSRLNAATTDFGLRRTMRLACRSAHACTPDAAATEHERATLQRPWCAPPPPFPFPSCPYPPVHVNANVNGCTGDLPGLPPEAG